MHADLGMELVLLDQVVECNNSSGLLTIQNAQLHADCTHTVQTVAEQVC